MNATVTTNTTGNMSEIIIKRNMGLKIIPCATADLTRLLKTVVVKLSNMGYAVIEK